MIEHKPTWGVDGNGMATVFCYVCREVFIRRVPPVEAYIWCLDNKPVHGCKETA